jgi:TolB-like protein
MSFITELKRRNVVRVGIAYVVASWLIVQIGDIARESFGAPDWVMKMVITALITGLPIVLFFSWAYELTPDGIKKEADVDRSQSTTAQTSKKLDLVTIALLIGAIVLVGLDRFVMEEPAQTVTSPPALEPGAEPAGTVANSASENSIAVLPFVNMSNDPDQDYFSDGISEELLNLLVRVDGLTVASRTSAFAYKGSTTSIPQIASELKVANVLEGSVRKSGNKVRITAQLIDTTNDRHLWSGSYDRDLDDIFQVQDEIATAIVSALKAELGLELDEGEISVTADTGDMDAYDLYLRGRELVLARRTLDVAVNVLQQAVERDPEFARAWAALATAAYLVPSWNVVPASEEHVFHDLARQANERALDLDPDQSQAWALKSMISQHSEGGPNYLQEIAALDRAIELDQHNSTAWLWRGIKYSEAGFQERGTRDMTRCLEIEPAYLNCQRHLAYALWILGRRDEALDYFEKGARAGFIGNDAVLATVLIYDGQTLAGILAGHHMKARYPSIPLEAWISAVEHPERDNRHYLPLALDFQETAEIIPVGVMEQLFLAFRGHEHLEMDFAYVNNWIWAPEFPELRRSPHFQRLINDLNLPEYWAEVGLPPGCSKQGEDYVCE